MIAAVIVWDALAVCQFTSQWRTAHNRTLSLFNSELWSYILLDLLKRVDRQHEPWKYIRRTLFMPHSQEGLKFGEWLSSFPVRHHLERLSDLDKKSNRLRTVIVRDCKGGFAVKILFWMSLRTMRCYLYFIGSTYSTAKFNDKPVFNASWNITSIAGRRFWSPHSSQRQCPVTVADPVV